MTTTSSHPSWRAATLDVLWRMRVVLWAAIFFAVWFALFSPALAQPQPFPWPPPNTGCPPNTSCIPGGFPGGGNPGQCTPNPNGDPGCNGAGNPVDIITGNKYQREIDLAPLPGELGLHFSRHYNSNSTHRGLTGVGWRSTLRSRTRRPGQRAADHRRRWSASDVQSAHSAAQLVCGRATRGWTRDRRRRCQGRISPGSF